MTAIVHVPRPEDDPEQYGPNAGTPRAARAAQKVRIAQRRAEVADLVLQQVSQREIARRLHVGLGTVGDDVRAVKAMWAERTAESYAQRVAEEDAKLDLLERKWLPKALDDEKAALIFLRIVERRAKLHGLDQPVKAEVTVSVDLAAEKARGLRLVSEVERSRSA